MTSIDIPDGIDDIANNQVQAPEAGQVVRVRTRTYLVEKVDGVGSQALVSLACLDDDAQGEQLQVIWGLELGTEILDRAAWKTIGVALENGSAGDLSAYGEVIHTDGDLVTLRASARRAAGTIYEWSVTGGRIVAGDAPGTALWSPPAEPGRYLVQVVAMRGDRAAAVGAIELEV